ncbi:translation initiation factor eIF-2B subunit delta [Sitophilus oryzae]|uniref:Translation initiation factor eIF2B subunit delta n=1 Tax=Sitophilus oryzae TaxID=7048 RepID=A0A6J2YYB6_SITOR|nr:translation initiation factor eIF-2B subunit delta [Sitophilus oryzae]
MSETDVIQEKSDARQKNNKKEKKQTEKSKTDGATNKLSSTGEDKLTEKQLRKLEWEKRLAEQKTQGNVNDVKEKLSKSELKAKRREQQEAQRQAKTGKDKETVINNVITEVKQVSPDTPKSQNNKHPEEKKSPVKKSVDIKKAKPGYVQLVQHLYREPKLEYVSKVVNSKEVHPVFVKLGVQYSEKVILGSNARCLALLSAIKTLIIDLQSPAKQEFCRYMEAVLQTCTNYLQDCRPFAVSMTNALRHFKVQLTHMDKNLSDNEKRAKLIDVIELYINNDIKRAWDAICMKVNAKIVNNDVILIYGCSSLIHKILLEANKSGKKFSVIIVDSRPLLEGREMLRRLVGAKIKCTYVLINALDFVMRQATKVLLGAHALLTNGSVMSRIGTAQVALVAQACNKPVLVCCETYKFSERVQTDSFVYNEIGDSNLLLSIDTSSTASPLVSLKDNTKLSILNILYDVTPPDLVTAVVTELAILPCTSVPVVLRINANENM